MGKYLNMKYTNDGYGMTLALSQFDQDVKYKGYAVKCQYKYHKKKEKYILHMWLKRLDIDHTLKIDHLDIDKQYISGTQKTIRPNICRIVEQAMKHQFFDKYIADYEYIIQCFEKGNEVIGN